MYHFQLAAQAMIVALYVIALGFNPCIFISDNSRPLGLQRFTDEPCNQPGSQLRSLDVLIPTMKGGGWRCTNAQQHQQC